jgi:hypothetical protein
MSQRLQVLLDPVELQEIRAIAKRRHMTVAEWVRQTLRAARRDEARPAAQTKLEAVQRALTHGFPTGDIDQMNAEIEQGYLMDGSE